ncbi:hypothetical protein JZ751_002253, partial [Albula glossodonta]
MSDGAVRSLWIRQGKQRSTQDTPPVRTQASPKVNSAAATARRSPSALTSAVTGVSVNPAGKPQPGRAFSLVSYSEVEVGP